MRIKFKDCLLMLLMATLVAADPEKAVPKDVFEEDILPYPYILTGVCCILMMLIVLYLHIRIPQIRSIYGWALPSFLAGLITLYFSFVIMNSHVTVIPCSALGYMLGFSIIVCICWFNVMCYDCYAVFSGRTRSLARYCLYGWGLPGAYLTICLALNNLNILEEKLKPPFTFWGCAIGNENQTADLLYFFLPMTLLMVVNGVLLVKTKLKVNKIVNQPEDTIRTDTKLDHERFGLTVLIFIAMIISFGLDMFSWAMEDYEWLYFMSNVSVYMLGVIIFFLFICNRHVDQWCGRSH
ncbi:probable G-protein coupled receptor Mth-like 12 [Culex pipiens pallens]|uniref:probable G-protein coupled receptor Mth-like 12 n=1 Tax=Culex pipiens pallens TaxID=42434 RepID=UPI00195498DA|nr:probable G-protein coupled receptor Mth-like 12 [Culex pipiens pallens]